MKKIIVLFLLLPCALLFCSCKSSAVENVSYAMGSAVTQKVYGKNGDTAVKNAMTAIHALDRLISYRDEKSEVSALNSGETVTPDIRVLELITLSNSLSAQTDGAYDITVLPIVLLWGFDGASPHLPTATNITEMLKKVGYGNIFIENGAATLKNGVQIDLSAAGKGEACEVAIEEYKISGLEGGIVTVGGSVGVFGDKNGKKFTVGIRDPFDKSGLLGTLYLTDAYISTSGSYEKQFSEDGVTYHHLLNPLTGYPVNSGLVSVTVICDDGGLSDMLASACFCVGIEKSKALLKAYSAEGVFVTTDGVVYITSGLDKIYNSDKPSEKLD